MSLKIKSEMRKFTEWMKSVDESGFNQRWKQIQEAGKELKDHGYQLQFTIPGLRPSIRKMNAFEKIRYKVIHR